MSGMTKVVSRWTLAVVVMAGLSAIPRFVRADVPATQQVASVQQLTLDAFSALKIGNFEHSNELLAKAASMSQDKNVQQMAGWVSQFETQRQQFTVERHKQYDKAVEDVKKLIDHHFDSYA